MKILLHTLLLVLLFQGTQGQQLMVYNTVYIGDARYPEKGFQPKEELGIIKIEDSIIYINNVIYYRLCYNKREQCHMMVSTGERVRIIPSFSLTNGLTQVCLYKDDKEYYYLNANPYE